MVECQLKDLFYNFDEKYFLRNTCKEQNIFMAISEGFDDKETNFFLVEEISLAYATTLPFDQPEVEQLISLHALTSFCAPQMLKSIGYMKHRKFIILVDNDITHICIHRLIS
jgi:hypothetical protein